MLVEELACAAGVPEITEYIEGCAQSTLKRIKTNLMCIISISVHPSAAYRSRTCASLMNYIWDTIWEYDSNGYLKGLILNRIVFLADMCWSHKDTVRKELRVLPNLWDASCTKPDVEEECKAVEDWDYLYLEENYTLPDPSIVSLERVAGHALNYIRTGCMTGGCFRAGSTCIFWVG